MTSPVVIATSEGVEEMQGDHLPFTQEGGGVPESWTAAGTDYHTLTGFKPYILCPLGGQSSRGVSRDFSVQGLCSLAGVLLTASYTFLPDTLPLPSSDLPRLHWAYRVIRYNLPTARFRI